MSNNNSSEKNRSLWREFEYLYDVVRSWIVPSVGWKKLFKNWNTTVIKLSESKRKRKTFMNTYYRNNSILK